jgi:hypothetical protein
MAALNGIKQPTNSHAPQQEQQELQVTFAQLTTHLRSQRDELIQHVCMYCMYAFYVCIVCMQICMYVCM